MGCRIRHVGAGKLTARTSERKSAQWKMDIIGMAFGSASMTKGIPGLRYATQLLISKHFWVKTRGDAVIRIVIRGFILWKVKKRNVAPLALEIEASRVNFGSLAAGKICVVRTRTC